MSLAGIILGLINILIVVVILVLVGALIGWALTALGWGPPIIVRKLNNAVDALIALYMLVALLLGIPSIHLVHVGAAPLTGGAA